MPVPSQNHYFKGMQGQLWSELVRTPEQMDGMIFPRLLPLAERAWHKASWEGEESRESRKRQETADWTLFANSLGYKELRRLDLMSVAYHIPPPGARFVDDKLEMNVALPGLCIEYSTDEGSSWSEFREPVAMEGHKDILLRTKSTDGRRFSRTVKLKGSTDNKDKGE